CITNIKAILSAAGSDISRVIKTTVFLTDMKNFQEVNGEYERHFGFGGDGGGGGGGGGERGKVMPARSCIAVRELPKGCEVEIECVALPGVGSGGGTGAGAAGDVEEEAARRAMGGH
ncbi:MAG: hypothetical protein LQ350_008655, partial [Teloschistes chrysophthalmus]